MDGRPSVIPAGWQEFEFDGMLAICRRMPNGLLATFTVEAYMAQDQDCPPLGPGVYHRIVLSRRKMYPTWDEMRAFIRSCGLFDNNRDVVMLLPPEKDYVNLHLNCFHWFQKVAGTMEDATNE